MAYENLLTEERDRVAYLTLNRPEKLNALTMGLMDELLHAAKAAEADDAVGCVVIQGAGRAFCSGWDLTPPTAKGDTGHGNRAPAEMTLREDLDSLNDRSGRWSRLWTLNKPIIVKVQGYCLAGGTDLALNCDLIVAAEEARFGFPAVRSMGSPSTHMWTYLVGPQWAKRLLLTGDAIDGRTAERIGLALVALPEEQLEDEIEALTRSLCEVPLDLLSESKAVLNRAVELMGRDPLQVFSELANATVRRNPRVDAWSRSASSGKSAKTREPKS